MSNVATTSIINLPAPTMGVDWSVLPEAVQWPYSPMSLDWIADGNSVSMRKPHSQKDNTTNFLHLASYDVDNTILAHVTSGGAGVWGTYEYDPITETATRIYTGNFSFGAHVNYQGRVFLAKAAGASSWDGTTFTATAFTGASGGSSLIGCCIYRDRYIQVQGTNMFYAPTAGALSGALSTFNLASYYTSGEFTAVAPITINDSNNLADYLIVVSSGGDILAFTGDFPGSANWQLVVRTKIDVIDFDSYGGGNLGLVPYAGDAWIFSRYPANIFSARALIQSGRVAAEAESPLAKQLTLLRRNNSPLRNVTYKRATNSLLIETQAGPAVESRVFGYTVTNVINNVWLNVNLSSGAVSPFSFPTTDGSLDDGPFFNKVISHNDGNVYALASDFTMWCLMDEGSSGSEDTDQTFLLFPYSNLGVEDSVKSLTMAYVNMAQSTFSIFIAVDLSVEPDGDRDQVQSFSLGVDAILNQYSKRFILPISGQGNQFGIAITNAINSNLSCESVSLQFEQGGPY